MNIENHHVVRLHYSVSEAGGEAIESSHGREPLAVLIGHRAIIPGLEEALLGRAAGDRFAVTVAPDKAYGERRPGLTQRLPRKHFKDQKLAVGMQIVVPTQMGPRPVTVEKLGLSVVDVDLNHPMAGKTLHFDVEVLEVRAATAEEKAHGHVHGEGGVQH
ncbi:peptidylprolyl isomerase [Silanimonas sp.]|uniref:FKBP-type peptidyl-prolyl cis-trans isomerase n=1 Tax=Silanimonas sp. TaxID=1929290 RepID=UPI001BC2B5D9|nr:peptidylprolyl isomerase [Silanimonas sp.]MBS3896212.1 peptidylprolyl isomerase [Silanimonas sp.]MBS3924081.1 peptidylprolyl isomerase [Xanthomonadaceae bacterium]